MAVYRGALCKLCRREGAKLFAKGDRCFTDKCGFERRAFAPGQHGQMRRRQGTEYGRQLREKQKAKRIYGVLEAQFRRYFREAIGQKGVVTGYALLRKLELRMDNVIYRMGFAPSRSSARQLILHNHFVLNDEKVNIPSIELSEGDQIRVRDKSKELAVIHNSLRNTARREELPWLQVDKVKLSGMVIKVPERDQIPTPIQEQLIVELYSKS